MLKHSLRGLGAAIRQPKLLLLLWAWSALLAATVAWPLWRWWSAAVRYAPATDPMLERFHMDIFKELLHADRTPVLAFVTDGVLAALGLTLILNAALAGGTLETLLMAGTPEPRAFLRRFFRGAGHFFMRFAGLLLLTLVGGGIAVVVVFLGVSAAVSGLDDGGWEPAWVIQAAAVAAAAAVTIVFFAIALDYARIRTAVDDRRGIVRTWIASVWLVLRHPLRTFGIWTLFGFALLVLVVVYSLTRDAMPATSWTAILVMASLQQLFVLARTGLRVATIAGEIDAYRYLQPTAATPVVPTPPSQPLVDAAPADLLPVHFERDDTPPPLDDLELEPQQPEKKEPE